MYAAEQYLAGLLIVHVAWIVFYLFGSLLSPPRGDETPARALLSIVIATACGMALLGFAAFAFGLIGLISPIGFAVLTVGVAITFVVRGDSPFQPDFWRARLRLVRTAAVLPVIVVYLVGLADAVPAMLPDREFDSLFYYDVLALEYARTHHLVIDMFLRNPFYANNWVLVEAWLYVFRAGDFIPFLTWFTGMLSMLGVFGAVLLELPVDPVPSRGRAATIYVIGGAAVATLLLNPMFLWLNGGGMIDVPLGFYFLAPALSCYLAMRYRDRSYVPAAVVTSAFLIGAKLSFIALFPLFVVVVWMLLRRLGAGRRQIVVGVAAVVVLSLPWYVDNLVLDGDPVPPIFNLWLHGRDVKFTPAEARIEFNMDDVRRNPIGMLALPIDAFTRTGDREFTSDGVTAIMLAVALPAILLMLGFLFPGIATELIVLSALLMYAIAYWMATSYHIRYALLFDAALAAFVGILLARLAARFPPRSVTACVVSLCFAIPTPSAWPWLHHFWTFNYEDAYQVYTDRSTFLADRVLGYRAAKYVASELARLGSSNERIYALGLSGLKYYFAQRDMTLIGDWNGPESYGNLWKAIDGGSAASFLSRFDVGVVVLSPTHAVLTPVRMQSFDRQLKRAGFTLGRCPDDVDIYIKDDPRAVNCPQ